MAKRFAKVGKKERGGGAETSCEDMYFFETDSTRAKGRGECGAGLSLVSCCRWFHYEWRIFSL